jgi:hypothetical protein
MCRGGAFDLELGVYQLADFGLILFNNFIGGSDNYSTDLRNGTALNSIYNGTMQLHKYVSNCIESAQLLRRAALDPDLILRTAARTDAGPIADLLFRAFLAFQTQIC